MRIDAFDPPGNSSGPPRIRPPPAVTRFAAASMSPTQRVAHGGIADRIEECGGRPIRRGHSPGRAGKRHVTAPRPPPAGRAGLAIHRGHSPTAPGSVTSPAGRGALRHRRPPRSRPRNPPRSLPWPRREASRRRRTSRRRPARERHGTAGHRGAGFAIRRGHSRPCREASRRRRTSRRRPAGERHGKNHRYRLKRVFSLQREMPHHADRRF